MNSTWLWTLIALQIAMGAFDTFYHHELTERLAWRPSQRRELKLHGVRNLLYAALFLTLGWLEVHGALAILAIAVLLVEVVITLMDFVEEDISRKLPASERINHTLLALNYGAILALLLPVLIGWAGLDTAARASPDGAWSLLASVSALGVGLFGLRDLAASRRCERLVRGPAAESWPMPFTAAHRPDHRGDRIHRRAARRGARTGRPRVVALTRNPAKLAGARTALHLDHEPRSASGRHAHRRDRQPRRRADRQWILDQAQAAKDHRFAPCHDEGRRSLIARLDRKPDVLVNGSAIGWYGLRGEEKLDEAAPPSACFTHEVCAAWEKRRRSPSVTACASYCCASASCSARRAACWRAC